MAQREERLPPGDDSRTTKLRPQDIAPSPSRGSSSSDDKETVPLRRKGVSRAARNVASTIGAAVATPPPGLSPTPGSPGSRLDGSSGARPSPTTATFFIGENIAGRFRVVRFIGRGGMGEVYEVEDLDLGVRVAIKTVRPEISSHPNAIERFKREINLARKVTHPNVCRTFELFHHQCLIPGTSDLHFFSMELLDGETLAARIRRVGRLTTTEAFPIVVQMAAGLEAAHQATIVHRDFKSQNVLLGPDDNMEGGIRAVITDFGLAHVATGEDSLTLQPSSTGEFVGSPPYMAPEQVEGGRVSPAADIYALGVVMYEMVCGTQPFVGDTPLATAMKRLKEPPPPPHRLVPDLDPQWEATILRCLERRPVNRFSSAQDVVNGLKGEKVTAPPSRKRRRLGLAAAALAALLVLGTGVAHYKGYLHFGRSAGPSPTAPLRRSVAVLGFRNTSQRPEVAWLSTAMSEILTSELAAGDKLRTVPQVEVVRTKIELSLHDPGNLPPGALGRLRSILNTDFVVLGSYQDANTAHGGQITLDLRLVDTRTGAEAARVDETGPEAPLYDLVSHAARDLRDKLEAGEVPKADRDATRAALPSNPEAARLYSEGLEKLHRFDHLAARDLLEKASGIEPHHALSHAALASTYVALGNRPKAVEEAKRALELSRPLPERQRLMIQGQYDETVGEWAKAAEVYRTLLGFFPDSLDYGLSLANAQISSGRAAEALSTLDQLRRLPAPLGQDPRIDYREAVAAGSLSEFERELDASRRAIGKARSQGARLLEARARLTEGWALQSLGKPGEAASSFEDGRRIFTEAGDQDAAAAALDDIAVLDAKQGNLEAARKAFEESISMARSTGNDLAVGKRLANLAMTVLGQQGQLDAAQKALEEALPLLRLSGDPNVVARAQNGLAMVLLERGDLHQAQTTENQALASFHSSGDITSEAEALCNLAEILRQQGALSGAQSHAGQALASFQKIGNRSGASEAQNELGMILLDRGDLAAARQNLEQALDTRNQLGEHATAAETKVALANLFLADGHTQEAEVQARAASEEFRAQNARDDTVMADVALARAFLDRGKMAEAAGAIEHCAPLAGATKNRRVSLLFAATAAYVRAAAAEIPAQEVETSSESLKSTILTSKSLGLLDLEYAARLTLGSLEMKYGNPRAGRSRLVALGKQASAAGFGLIARDALSARTGATQRSAGN